MTVAEAIAILQTFPPDLDLVHAGTWYPISDIRQDSYLGASGAPMMCVIEESYPVPRQ